MNEKSDSTSPGLCQGRSTCARRWAIAILVAAGAGVMILRASSIGQSSPRWTTGEPPVFVAAGDGESGTASQQSNDTYFDWDGLSPSRDLDYVPCYGKFQCARLLLPMDWTAPEESWRDHEVAIAMIKQPANVSVLDPRYGGEVYLNPGGPGVQGVGYLTGRLNNHLAAAVNGDDPAGKVFDLVSFDPRGVGFSTPRISCFDDLVSRQLWHQLGTVYGYVDTSDRSFDQLWARAQSLEKLCDTGDSTSIKTLALSSVTTAFVARDMVAMVERSGEARERRARVALAENLGKAPAVEIPEPLRYQPGKELLQSWGISYGSFLGGTFASLYPERVGRMILDGCGDFVDAASGEYEGWLVDTDKEWHEFFKLCHAAGPERCPIYDAEGPDAMQQSIQDLLDSLERDPLPVWEEGMAFPDILTKDALVAGIRRALYWPYRDRGWARFAETLSSLLNGTVTPGVMALLPPRKLLLSTDQCRTPECVTEGLDGGFWADIEIGIHCTDGPDFRNVTKSEMAPSVKKLVQQSPLFGGWLATIGKLPCTGYPVRPKWRFSGPFGGKTKNPVLFIGNTLDPVTPLEGTRSNVPLFEGARMLQQDSVGHCSTGAPSKCTVSQIRRYFVSGELPEEGTICPVDILPFDVAE